MSWRFKMCIIIVANSLLASVDSASGKDFAALSSIGAPLNANQMGIIRQKIITFLDQSRVAALPGIVCSGCLIDHWSSTSSSMYRSFHESQVESVIVGLPEKMAEAVRVGVYSDELVSNVFSKLSLPPDASAAVESIGQFVYILCLNGNCELAVFKCQAVGKPVQKYQVRRHRKCVVGICREWDEQIPRGYTEQENHQRMNAIQAEIYRCEKELAQGLFLR